MTPNEIEFSRNNKDCYFLYRVYDLNKQPSLYILSGDILDEFHAEPIEFRMIKK